MRNANLADKLNRHRRSPIASVNWVNWYQMTDKQKEAYKKAEQEYMETHKKDSSTEQ